MNEKQTVQPVSPETNERFSLVDGAVGEIGKVAEGVASQQRILVDQRSTLEEKLEAYEDIIDSEVGDTTLSRARNLERELGIRQIYMKFEGSNPSGTQKDRIAFSQALDALRRGFDTITVATCGNYGVAVSLAASLAGLRCVVFIPESYHTNRIREMELLGAEILRTNGAYEHAVLESREYAALNELYDANPGGANTDLQLRSYGQIAYEIYDELRDAPHAVGVPVSNGSTLAGIQRGFLSLYRRGKTSRMPRMVAGSSYRKNPIVHAFLHQLDACADLIPERIRETRVNEPLINWHSIDGDLALVAIRASGGWAANASDRKLMDMARMVRDREGLSVVPASTAGLVAMVEAHKENPLPHDRYVVVLTGRKS